MARRANLHLTVLSFLLDLWPSGALENSRPAGWREQEASQMEKRVGEEWCVAARWIRVPHPSRVSRIRNVPRTRREASHYDRVTRSYRGQDMTAWSGFASAEARVRRYAPGNNDLGRAEEVGHWTVEVLIQFEVDFQFTQICIELEQKAKAGAWKEPLQRHFPRDQGYYIVEGSRDYE